MARTNKASAEKDTRPAPLPPGQDPTAANVPFAVLDGWETRPWTTRQYFAVHPLVVKGAKALRNNGIEPRSFLSSVKALIALMDQPVANGDDPAAVLEAASKRSEATAAAFELFMTGLPLIRDELVSMVAVSAGRTEDEVLDTIDFSQFAFLVAVVLMQNMDAVGKLQALLR